MLADPIQHPHANARPPRHPGGPDSRAHHPPIEPTRTTRPRRGLPRWIQRLGVAGFLFFFIKGLMWLALPALIALWRHLER